MDLISKDKFQIITSSIITKNGKILIGKKEQDEGDFLAEEWAFPGIRLGHDENIENATSKKLEEKTGIEMEIHQLIDCYQTRCKSDSVPIIRIIYHCEASSEDVEPLEDLSKINWILPENLEKELGESDSELIDNRRRVSKFIEKIEKMPAM